MSVGLRAHFRRRIKFDISIHFGNGQYVVDTRRCFGSIYSALRVKATIRVSDDIFVCEDFKILVCKDFESASETVRRGERLI